MKNILTKIVKYALFMGVGSAIMIWFYTNQNASFQEQLRLDGQAPYPLINKLIDDFRSVNLFWVGLSLIAFTISNWSRAVRWNMLIHPLGFRPKTLNSFFAVNISYFTNLWMSRAGEVVRAGTLAKVEGMSVSRVMGTVVVDRILDMISLILIVAFGFLVEYETLWGYLDKNMGSGDGSFRLLRHPLFLGIAGFGIASIVLIYVLRKKYNKLALFKRYGIW